MALVTDTTASIEALDRDEGLELLDRQARELLGMSGEEFVCAWDSGTFAKDPERPEVMRVAMLLPFAR